MAPSFAAAPIKAAWTVQRSPFHRPAATAAPVRVVVADDQALVRTGLSCIVGAEDDFEVVAEVMAEDAPAVARQFSPDVLVLVGRDEASTRGVLRRLAATSPRFAVLLLTSDRGGLSTARAEDLGVRAIVALEQPASTLIAAIERVSEDACRAPGTCRTGRQASPEHDSEEARLATLTRREREVLKLTGEGLRNLEIAQQLALSPSTVRNHVTSILDKLCLTDRFDLAVFAYRHGLVRFRQKRAAS